MANSPGAELHRGSVVVEGHRDCYEQIHRINQGETDPINDVMAPRLLSGGVDLTVYAIGGDSVAHSNGTSRPLLATLANIDAFDRSIERSTFCKVVLTSEDLPRVSDGVLRFLLHLEGGSPLEGRLSTLRSLFRLGLRSMQLTWNVRNELGDGVIEEETGSRLTTFGVDVVKEMNELGMVVDLAHIAQGGFWHAIETSQSPVVATHANSKTLFDHPRNLTDEQATAIAATGGVVGVQVTPKFLGDGGATLEDFVDHICFYGELLGFDHVGLGLDFSANDGPRPAWERAHPGKQRFLEGLGEVDELPNLTDALVGRGLTDAQISGVLGANFARVFEHVLPHG